jgi:hypothetical protein
MPQSTFPYTAQLTPRLTHPHSDVVAVSPSTTPDRRTWHPARDTLTRTSTPKPAPQNSEFLHQHHCAAPSHSRSPESQLNDHTSCRRRWSDHLPRRTDLMQASAGLRCTRCRPDATSRHGFAAGHFAEGLLSASPSPSASPRAPERASPATGEQTAVRARLALYLGAASLAASLLCAQPSPWQWPCHRHPWAVFDRGPVAGGMASVVRSHSPRYPGSASPAPPFMQNCCA